MAFVGMGILLCNVTLGAGVERPVGIGAGAAMFDAIEIACEVGEETLGTGTFTSLSDEMALAWAATSDPAPSVDADIRNCAAAGITVRTSVRLLDIF